jgi:hypothetical protein
MNLNIDTLSVPQKLRNVYLNLDQKYLARLDKIYDGDVQFRNPLCALNGVESVTNYFSDLVDDLDEWRCEFHHCVEDFRRGEAVLFWTFYYRHKKLAGGDQLELTGNTHIRFFDKIYYHRDYFDAGSMLYEHIPFVGSAIRMVKKRIGAQ